MGACWKLLVETNFWHAPFVSFWVVTTRFLHDAPQKCHGLTPRERLTLTESLSHRAPRQRQRMSPRSRRDRRSIRRNRPPVEHDGERSCLRAAAAGGDDAEESLAVERRLTASG